LNLLDRRRRQDRGDDPDLAATVRAVLEVEFKGAIDRSFGQRIR